MRVSREKEQSAVPEVGSVVSQVKDIPSQKKKSQHFKIWLPRLQEK